MKVLMTIRTLSRCVVTGRPTRIILDIVGAELMGMLFNISLVMSDGRSLASDWVRHTGGPNDPQYATTLTWPAEVR